MSLPLEPERVERLRARGDEDALRLQVELERLEPELAAEAGLLVPAERDSREGGVRHVDPDCPGLDPTCKPVAPRGISGPDGCHQPVPDVVRDADRVLLILERDHRHDRPKDLLLGDGHRALDRREHRRRIEGTLAVAEPAARDDLGTLLTALLDEAVHLVAMLRGDERAHLRLGIERIADPQLLGLAGELRHEVVIDRPLDEHARTRLAALTGRVVDRPYGARNRILEIRVREDEVGTLTAELQRDPLDRPGGQSHDLAARFRRARERDLVDPGMAHEVRTGRLPRPGDDVNRAGW